MIENGGGERLVFQARRPQHSRMAEIAFPAARLVVDPVFLLVLLGTAISRSSEDSLVPPSQNEMEADKKPNEPLAEIGAAPGATLENETSEAASTNSQ